VWSTRSPQPFHIPKCPNCNEGESENPSARKESCCIICGHNILRCPRVSVLVNWGHPHDSIIIQGATSHASGAEITKLLRRPPVPIFLRRERYRTLGNRREATGSVVTELVCASGSERSGQFCSQRSEFFRSRDRNFRAVALRPLARPARPTWFRLFRRGPAPRRRDQNRGRKSASNQRAPIAAEPSAGCGWLGVCVPKTLSGLVERRIG
jgi:hypothetical protein